MNAKLKMKNEKWEAGLRALLFCHFAFLVINSGAATNGTNAVMATNTVAAKPEKLPANAREFFNAGTRRLQEVKLREAEAFFQSALSEQNVSLQAPTLHNLGHVRYGQGSGGVEKISRNQCGHATFTTRAGLGRRRAAAGRRCIGRRRRAKAGQRLPERARRAQGIA
jgi:hypothetical protein